MPPQLALFFCILLILFLCNSDSKREPKVSSAIWIPLIWIMAIGSRPLAWWFQLPGAASITEAEAAYLEGSPLDRTLFIILIIIGTFVLSRRRIDWSEITRSNKLLFLWLLYTGISILWSDYSFVAFKRWIMGVGYFVMALVVLTDTKPIEAAKSVFRRYSYAFIPLSIVLIKYYPSLGVIYGPWSGAPEYCGITQTKNLLGQLCVICGIFFLWQFFSIWRTRRLSRERSDLFTILLFLSMIFWLLAKSHSATSLAAIMTSLCIFVGFSDEKKLRRLGFLSLVAIFTFLVLDSFLHVTQTITSLLGRDTTLSGRTELWSGLMATGTNPLFGTGFESFWLGERAHAFWEKYWWRPNQAHNGYIDIYLNLGLLGVFLVGALMIATFNRSRNSPLLEIHSRQFHSAYLIAFMITNITENVFKGLMWFFFLLIAIDLPQANHDQDRPTESVS